MKIIGPSYEILDRVDELILINIERAGRICYKSTSDLTVETAKKFVKKIIQSGHESVIEHEKITVKFICDRGVSHEIVRHRIVSYSQESTRYCNYGKKGEIVFIKPFLFEEGTLDYDIWYNCCFEAARGYSSLIMRGVSSQWARSVLPNSLKTEIIVTFNLREWRHFFKLRVHKTAHPQMREITIPLLKEFKSKLPVVFDDITIDA